MQVFVPPFVVDSMYSVKSSRRQNRAAAGGYISTMSAVIDEASQKAIETLPPDTNYKAIIIPEILYDAQPEAIERVIAVLQGIYEAELASAVVPEPAEESVSVAEDVAAPQPEKESQYGYIAREFFAHKWYNNPKIQNAIGQCSDQGQAHGGMKHSYAIWAEANVSDFSLADLSPHDWTRWAIAHNCATPIEQMLHNAEIARVQQEERKARKANQ